MPYVPGFQTDIFVSYAHADDVEWIARFVDRLKVSLKRLGVDASFWVDDNTLRASRDFRAEIPDCVRSSALFLLLASPSYLKSRYCVAEECAAFRKAVEERKARFSSSDFSNELFVFSCPILPIARNEHRDLFPGASDIPFFSEEGTFAIGAAEFDTGLRKLTREIIRLLEAMRSHSTPVFLYPRAPGGGEVAEARQALADELAARSFRVLPDRETRLAEQLREASISVFLLGAQYDENAPDLVDVAAASGKPWLAWRSSEAALADSVDQAGFSSYIEQLESSTKRFLNERVTRPKLKEEVLELLRPDQPQAAPVNGKPRVYLVYNSRDPKERGNAGLIAFHYRKEFQFDLPDDPAQHMVRLTGSDGVLLVWGNSAEDWCSREFEALVQTSRSSSRGLCLFDPKETKTEVVDQIKSIFSSDVYIGEQFGKFDPARLEPFFTPLRRQRAQGGQA